jgi:hypothetical protein
VNRRCLIRGLALLVLLAQSALAWHAPSHLHLDTDAGPVPLIQSIHCDLCLSGQALATPPATPAPTPTPTATREATPNPRAAVSAPPIPGLGARAPPRIA